MGGLTKTSKFLAYVLRHKPEAVNIEIDEGGWTDLRILADRLGVNIGVIKKIVEEDKKQRYMIKDGRIKANQGHSVKGIIAFDTTPRKPPYTLYHGTTWQRFQKIKEEGLLPMKRHHVHLSPDIKTAEVVAMRHRKETPYILSIDSEKMAKDGRIFYLSDNGVWLTDAVLPEYIIEETYVEERKT